MAEGEEPNVPRGDGLMAVAPTTPVTSITKPLLVPGVVVEEELTGICREDMRSGARVSDGLGEWVVELHVLLTKACVTVEVSRTEVGCGPDGMPSDDTSVVAGMGVGWEGTN